MALLQWELRPLKPCWQAAGTGGLRGPGGAQWAPLSVAFLELISPECCCHGAERRPGCCILQRKLPLCCSAKVREKTGPRAHLSRCWLLSCLNVTPDQTGNVNEIRLLGYFVCGSRGRVAKSVFSLWCNRVFCGNVSCCFINTAKAMTLTTIRKATPPAGPCAALRHKDKKLLESWWLVRSSRLPPATTGQLEVRVEIWRWDPGGSLPPLGGSLLKKEKGEQNVQLRCRDTRFTVVETHPAEVNRSKDTSGGPAGGHLTMKGGKAETYYRR